MTRTPVSLLACIATCVLALQAAPALAGRAHVAASAAPIDTGAPSAVDNPAGTSGDPRSSRRAGRKGRQERPQPAAAKAAAVAAQKSPRNAAADGRKAEALEQSAAESRADRLYAASQTSAPIIVDARACKRIGANGESIYENC